MLKTQLADRIAGAIMIIFGAGAISEAIRLYPMRMRELVGDDTLTGLLGAALVILGVMFMFVFKPETCDADFPTGKIRSTIFKVFFLLFAYWLLLDFAGYMLSTLVIAAALFRTIGEYKWLVCLGGAVVLTAVFYGTFVLWLDTPFPQPVIRLF